MRLRGLTLAALALSACSDAPTPAARTNDAPPARTLDGPCPVTVPGGELPLPEPDFNYGDRSLAASIWPEGRLVAGTLPDGSAWAEINADGSIYAKLGWWRGVQVRLSIEGERLDAPAPPLRAHVPEGYGPSGFQATGLTFPTTGCWRVRGRVADASLTFVVRVRKRR